MPPFRFQLQRVKVEKQLIEKQRLETEEKLKRVSRQAEDLNRKFEEVRKEKEDLAKENLRLKQQVRRVEKCSFFLSAICMAPQEKSQRGKYLWEKS